MNLDRIHFHMDAAAECGGEEKEREVAKHLGGHCRERDRKAQSRFEFHRPNFILARSSRPSLNLLQWTGNVDGKTPPAGAILPAGGRADTSTVADRAPPVPSG